MEKDETQDIDLDNNEDELDLDLSDDETDQDDTKDWKAEALKYKSMATRYKGKLEKPQVKKEVAVEISKQEYMKPSDILKADEFKLHRQGYNEDEIDLIMHNGGMKILKDEKSPLFLGLKVAKEQRLAESASDSTNNTAGTSEVERKHTPEQMRNMDTEELAKLIGFTDGN